MRSIMCKKSTCLRPCKTRSHSSSVPYFSVQCWRRQISSCVTFFSDELELPSVKYLCEAYYSGPLLSAFNSYHSQHDNSCKINFIKSVTRNFSFFSLCVDFCDSWKGHEKVEQCLKTQIMFLFHSCSLGDCRCGGSLETSKIGNF